jgi:eukaryotic-like serine/threonine-protein kinase
MLSAGQRLGPYEILAPLGAGGMGEVFRARDTRLGRDVAIKVLPASFASDAERLRRFEQEARTIAALNHPNILAIYDIGTHDCAPFLVTELLEGETLRERLRGGPLAVRKALDVAVQAAHGVAAAHEKGIVHRDLKPANIFLTSDSRVKILDFGLAKLAERGGSGISETQSPTRTAEAQAQTEAGVVLGTAGYMSPEQVRGKPADARSDIFALGTILYEMLSGQRAFEKDSSADTMAAILKEEPPELSGEGKKIAPAVERIVRHCLEKNPAERFQSARDLAFDLEVLSGLSTTSATALAAAKSGSRKWIAPAAAAIVLIVVATGSFIAGEWKERAPGFQVARFIQLNYQPEAVFNARFAPDGATVVFSAAPEGNIPQLFVHRPDYPAPQPIGLPGTALLSISSRGELAVLTGARNIRHNVFTGTLARMELGGGAAREILQDVQSADWAPDGSGLAIIREVGGKSRVEYPIGTVLFETAGYVSDLRFSPRGDQIAFFEHPFRYDDRGSIDVVDLQSHKKVLSKGYQGEEGLAWEKDGDTIYFGAQRGGESNYLIRAVTLAGKARDVLSGAEALWIFDTNREGNFLATENTHGWRLMSLAPGAKAERDLSWLDASDRLQLSPDGQWLLFTDYTGGSNYALLLRRTDGSPVVRLGEGAAMGLSPDGAWALSLVPGPPPQLVLYPTGAGERRVLDRGNIENYDSAQFFPDGKRVLACGNEPGHAPRCYLQDISGGPLRPVTPEGTRSALVFPDGQSILVQGPEGNYSIYPLTGGSGQPVLRLAPEDIVIRSSADGRSALVFRTSEIPARVERVDLSTGRRTPVRELAPADRAGVLNISHIAVAENGSAYAYSYYRNLSGLTVIEGAK